MLNVSTNCRCASVRIVSNTSDELPLRLTPVKATSRCFVRLVADELPEPGCIGRFADAIDIRERDAPNRAAASPVSLVSGRHAARRTLRNRQAAQPRVVDPTSGCSTTVWRGRWSVRRPSLPARRRRGYRGAARHVVGTECAVPVTLPRRSSRNCRWPATISDTDTGATDYAATASRPPHVKLMGTIA